MNLFKPFQENWICPNFEPKSVKNILMTKYWVRHGLGQFLIDLCHQQLLDFYLKRNYSFTFKVD